ncbi:DUF1775 domain-containing protein [Actinoplanes sp. NPDC051346]|uniref:DUF1775 domain-containing protein n=1 Tax=Actinoplanes sp. NPDC051346 TaxID=3155048 RepID=UPI00342F025E
MSRLEKHRRAGLLAAAVAAGVLGLATPAAADVTVNPSSVPQGSGQNVAFRVTNTARSPLTRIKVVLPPEMPVAEVYPLSVQDWAPQTENRKLDTPLVSSHGGTPVTETTATITWIAMPGKALAPGKSTDLTVAMGGLPTTGTRMSFTLQPTYADPAKGAPIPPTTLTLTPAVAGGTAGHSTGHGATTGAGTSAEDAAMLAALAQATADDGPGFSTVAGWVVAGLLAIGGAVVVARGRRRAESGTGPRVTLWSYKDGPKQE